MKENEKLPSFMVDDSEGDTKAEIIMDFVLSWCLRCAKDLYVKQKPILSSYCRYMLSKLIEEEINESVFIKDVRAKKEWRRIDLTVEVYIVKGGEELKHAILIENKYYSRLREDTFDPVDGERKNQLLVYKNVFDGQYGDDWTKHYCLLTCYTTDEEVKSVYGDVKSLYGFNAFPFGDVLNPTNWKDDGWLQTESDIFNEFWLNW